MLSSAKKPKPKSYAQAAKSANPSAKISLLHTDCSHNPDENAKYSRIIQTRIYRTARNKGATLFDISPCKEKYTDQRAMTTVRKQHPNAQACTVLNEGPTRYLEVYIKPEKDTEDINRIGVIFEDSKIKVLPCRSIDDTATVIHLKLSHLPMFTSDEVLEGLKQSLAIFGELLDVGIYTENASGFFMGTGYAVLNTFQPVGIDPKLKYPDLSHQINWCESTNEFFHATWNNMPTWCRYCHKDGHTKFDCPLSRARILCYSCHEQGHRSYECPRRNAVPTSNKKQDRKSYKSKDTPPSLNQISPDIQEQLGEQATEVSSSGPDIQPTFINDDAMSTSGDDNSTVDEDEDIFRVNVQSLKKDIDTYSPEKITQAIRELCESKEIAPIGDKVDSQGVMEWTVLQRTDRATALVGWLNHNKFAYLSQSPSITPRRPSQLTVGDYISPSISSSH